MREIHPDYGMFQVQEPSDDGRVKVRKPHWEAGKYIKVPAQNLREARSYAAGAGVIVGFEDGNKQLPFLERMGTYMGEVAQPIPIFVNYAWAHARGGWRNNFVAGVPGAMLDIDSEPVQLDTLTKAGDILGLLLYEVESTPILAVRSDPGLMTGVPGYTHPWFWTTTPLVLVDDTSDYVFWDHFNSLGTNVRTPANFAYCAALNLLIHTGPNVIKVFDALTGSDSASPVIDGSEVDPITNYTTSYATHLGITVVEDILVKTFHSHSYTHNYSTSVTTETSGDAAKIIALQLPGSGSSMTTVWSWSVNKVWNGGTIPFRNEVANCLPTLGGAQPTTADWGNRLSGSFLFLYGNPAVYFPSETPAEGLIVFPVTGRKVSSSETYTYTTEDGLNYRERSVEGQWSSGQLATGAQTPEYLHGKLKPWATIGNAANSDGGPAGSRYLYNFLVALKVQPSTSDGEVAWKYQFPELDATEHYLVDTDSFGKVASSPWVAAWTSDIEGQTVGDDVWYFADASASSDIVHPDQVYVAEYKFGGAPGLLVGNRHDILDGSVEDYLYWPNGAAYYWDPITTSNTGSNAPSTPRGFCQNSTVGDEGGNTYGVWLQPKIFVTCADIWHRPDASVVDRTHASAQANYSTRHNGYESDRLTPIPDKVDVWAMVDDYVIESAGEYYDVFELTAYQVDATFYGFPHKVVMFRSFMGKWNSAGELVWSKELTTLHDETIDDSPGLAGQLPYPGVTLRICPTSAGVFVLRLVRLPIETSLREPALCPQRNYRDEAGQNAQDFVVHTRNTKAILELRNPENGNVVWEQTVFDSTSMAPSWCCGAALFASESPAAGEPWVTGRVDFSKNYDAETLWMEDPPDYGSGLARISKVFTCDFEGNIEIRNAGEHSMDSVGQFPYDFINDLSHDNGRSRCAPSLLNAGVLQYPVGPTDFKLWGQGDGVSA